jgi:hypothetical protein
MLTALQGRGTARLSGVSFSSLRFGQVSYREQRTYFTGLSASALSPKVRQWLFFLTIDGLIQDVELYLLAFGPLRQTFKPSELNDFVDIMVERGLRIRRGLEEYGQITERTRGILDDTNAEGSDDEIEHEAKERHRLMPY